MNMKKTIKFSKFLMQADILAKTIGLLPYDIEEKPPRFEKLMKCFFVIVIINLNIVLLSEILFVIMAMMNGNNFVEATMNLTFIGFVIVGDIKIFSVLQKKQLLTILMRDLNRIYPSNATLQTSYHVREYLNKYNLVSFGFVVLHEILLWFYNLYTVMSYLIYEYWLELRLVPRNLPFFCWVPWHWQSHWSYYPLYVSQNFASHTCISGQLVNDLLLCFVATQIIMHYRYLASRIANYEPLDAFENNQLFLKNCIQYHQTIFNLSLYMNEVFGVSLLINFISSIFTMCFLGFQMTIGIQADTLVMLLLFLLCSMVQIYMICNYGQELITKSESIGHAVYNHKWLNTDLRYRKMLILIIRRSQKPTLMKATTFLNVSLVTMTDLLQLSYKFFALIRTMYSK